MILSSPYDACKNKYSLQFNIGKIGRSPKRNLLASPIYRIKSRIRHKSHGQESWKVEWLYIRYACRKIHHIFVKVRVRDYTSRNYSCRIADISNTRSKFFPTLLRVCEQWIGNFIRRKYKNYFWHVVIPRFSFTFS